MGIDWYGFGAKSGTCRQSTVFGQRRMRFQVISDICRAAFHYKFKYLLAVVPRMR